MDSGQARRLLQSVDMASVARNIWYAMLVAGSLAVAVLVSIPSIG
jgi:hypothetical protein